MSSRERGSVEEGDFGLGFIEWRWRKGQKQVAERERETYIEACSLLKRGGKEKGRINSLFGAWREGAPARSYTDLCQQLWELFSMVEDAAAQVSAAASAERERESEKESNF